MLRHEDRGGARVRPDPACAPDPGVQREGRRHFAGSELPFEAAMVRRAKPMEFAPGLVLPCCTAEDLFIMKAFAARPRDWTDAESIVARQASLDKRYILRSLKPLCELKETPELLERAKRLLGKPT